MTSSEIEESALLCLEVWGGNEQTRRLALPGLELWLHPQAHKNACKGGDLYYISSCATGRIIRLLLADVSGHGLAEAGMADQLRNLMRKHINQLDQRRFARAINSAFTRLSSHGLFATALIVTYFAPTSTLALTNAGHPPPLLFKARTGRWHEVAEQSRADSSLSDIPLGVLKTTQYSECRITLETGDIVCCFTDAYSECRDADKALLGSRGLLALLNRINCAPEHVIPELQQALQNMNPDNLLQDDATVLIFSPNNLFEAQYQTPGMHGFVQLMYRMLSRFVNGERPLPLPDLHPANLGGMFSKKLNRLWHAKVPKA